MINSIFCIENYTSKDYIVHLVYQDLEVRKIFKKILISFIWAVDDHLGYL